MKTRLIKVTFLTFDMCFIEHWKSSRSCYVSSCIYIHTIKSVFKVEIYKNFNVRDDKSKSCEIFNIAAIYNFISFFNSPFLNVLSSHKLLTVLCRLFIMRFSNFFPSPWLIQRLESWSNIFIVFIIGPQIDRAAKL